VVAWSRRRLLPWGARLLALAALALLAAWCVGRIVNDDTHWGQYLYWLPTLGVVLAAWVLIGVSTLLGWLSLRLGGHLLRPIAVLGAIALTVWMVVGEWRAWSVVRVQHLGPQLRIVAWNMANKPHLIEPGQAVLALEPDLAIVANPPFSRDRAEIARALGGLAPAPEVDTTTPGGTNRSGGSAEHAEPDGPGGPHPLAGLEAQRDVHFVVLGPGMITSRFPILRVGTTRAAPLPERDEQWRTEDFGGSVTFVELDVSARFPAFTRPLVVWLVDAPSDPTLHRARVMERLRAAVDGWTGQGASRPLVKTPMGAMVQAADDDAVRFPEPDVIVGDFNTPRGSRSVRTLVGDLADAHARAGLGPDHSWPMRWPPAGRRSKYLTWMLPRGGWGIDLAFVGRAWRTVGYDVAAPPAKAQHGLQVVDVVSRVDGG
jgi:hypothetical protein